jgi:hypothetical protein
MKKMLPWEKQNCLFLWECSRLVSACVCACAPARGRRRVNGRVWPYLPSMQSACAVLYCHMRPLCVPPYFSTLSHKRLHSRGKVIEYEMCIFIFSTIFSENISHSKKNSARYWHKCKNLLVILVVFLWNLNFPGTFSKKAQISNVIKICPLEVELLHMHGQAWRT